MSREEVSTEGFEDAERFILTDDEGHDETYVIMAIAELDGKDYAMLAQEDDLESPAEEMAVYVFEYARDGDGNVGLLDIEDETKQEEVYNYFAELMKIKDGETDEDD
jgi:uncharacterized protein YrzB (UPF0473 family)